MFSRLVSSVSSALDFNQATLSGCIDIIVVPGEDGRLQSTPFHVRFGKAKLLRSKEKLVDISVNWKPTNLKMRLGAAGEAYFIVEDSEDSDSGLDASSGNEEFQDEELSVLGSGFCGPQGSQSTREGNKIGASEMALSRLSSSVSQPTARLPSSSSSMEVTSTSKAFDQGDDVIEFFSAPTQAKPRVRPPTEGPPSECLDERIGGSQASAPGGGAGFAEDPRHMHVGFPGRSAASSDGGEQGCRTSFESAVREVVPEEEPMSRIQISLCGHLLYGTVEEAQHDRDVFVANMLTWQSFEEDPARWFHPSLVVRFDQAPPFFPATVAFPLILSWVLFRKPIGANTLQQLLRTKLSADIPDLSEAVSDSGYNFERKRPHRSRSSRVKPLVPKNRSGKPGYSISMPDEVEADSSRRGSLPAILVDGLAVTSSLEVMQLSEGGPDRRCQNLLCGGCQSASKLTNDEVYVEDSETRFGKMDPEEHDEPVFHSELLALAAPDLISVGHSVLPASVAAARASEIIQKVQHARFRKSLRPSYRQLDSLNLKPGPNSVTFSVTSALQGTKSVTGTIYLWPRNAKVVISDVDGTITKSDVWGQLMPIVGRDWSHAGVAELFSEVRKNGYRILYLTARAIGQADSTRDYLFGLTQGTKSKLPDGPLILSPDRLFLSFKREVIDRKPYVFKIAALRDIRNLFPPFYNPFFAGFGNRDTDHRAYVHIGVPEAKIFIIDPTGTVHHVNTTYAKTYESMTSIAAEMFPALDATSSSLQPLDEKVSSAVLERREAAFRDLKMSVIKSGMWRGKVVELERPSLSLLSPAAQPGESHSSIYGATLPRIPAISEERSRLATGGRHPVRMNAAAPSTSAKAEYENQGGSRKTSCQRNQSRATSRTRVEEPIQENRNSSRSKGRRLTSGESQTSKSQFKPPASQGPGDLVNSEILTFGVWTGATQQGVRQLTPAPFSPVAVTVTGST